jgi:hypothetical protein
LSTISNFHLVIGRGPLGPSRSSDVDLAGGAIERDHSSRLALLDHADLDIRPRRGPRRIRRNLIRAQLDQLAGPYGVAAGELARQAHVSGSDGADPEASPQALIFSRVTGPAVGLAVESTKMASTPSRRSATADRISITLQ